MHLTIKIARELPGWYRAWCPALPGCLVHGRSYAEAAEDAGRAVRAYLTDLNAILPRELKRRSVAARRRGGQTPPRQPTDRRADDRIR
jgi:predicted RNase H-like HicB family nuclease